jgi:DNA polymerase-3 subunit epsilon
MNEKLREIINRKNFIVLDTETTGLRRPAEIIDIAIINPKGGIILDTLLKPKGPIPGIVTSIHGLTAEICANGPTWPQLKPEILAAIKGKDILVYNAKYDRHMMHCSDEMYGLDQTDYHADGANWYCVMEAYADFYGEWDPYHGSNKWQRLTAACEQQGVIVTGAHRALLDALMTLDLVRKLTAEMEAWKWLDFVSLP